MTFENLLLTVSENGIATLSINRPAKYNALNIATIAELSAAFDHIAKSAEIKAVIITGEGEKAFVAGADISEIAQLDSSGALQFAQNGQAAFAKIESSLKPVIAVVNGFALGGGCELAMACHIRVASETAKFGLPEVSLGLIPGYGGTQRLPQLVGKGRALEIMLTGDQVSAAQALNIGLVNHVVPTKAEAMDKATEIASKIMTKGLVAVGLAIDAVNHAVVNSGYAVEADRFGAACNTEDFKEGTSAFLEKRTAAFKGR